MYCKARLRVPHDGLTLVWSWLEKTDQYAPFLGALSARTIPALCEAVAAGARSIVYVPDKSPRRTLSDREHVAAQFAFFCRVVAECRRARVLVEELMHVTSPSWSPPRWGDLSTAGAHDHLELIATAQRPTMIDKAFIANCTAIRCYRLVYEEDARTLGRLLRVPYTDLMDLPRFCYRHRVIEDRETVSGVQEIVSA
jgi:hypothetical protein